jgi:hypothetical protein
MANTTMYKKGYGMVSSRWLQNRKHVPYILIRHIFLYGCLNKSSNIDERNVLIKVQNTK